MDALIGKIGVGPLKSLLFAGLLPSALLIVSWTLYWHGIEGAASALSGAVTAPKNVVPLLASWVVLGLALLVLRVPVLAFFGTMPSNPLEEWLLQRKLIRRNRVTKRRRELEWL